MKRQPGGPRHDALVLRGARPNETMSAAAFPAVAGRCDDLASVSATPDGECQATPLRPCTVHEGVARQASRTPPTVALLWRHGDVTYSAPEARGKPLPPRLQARGIRPGCFLTTPP